VHRPIVYTTFDNLDEATQVQAYDGDGVTITPSGADGSVGPTMKVSRSLYDQVAADADGAWAELREEVSSGYFVDINRLMMA
jgi:hypothetical protein